LGQFQCQFGAPAMLIRRTAQSVALPIVQLQPASQIFQTKAAGGALILLRGGCY
jgi:hypothetical protein